MNEQELKNILSRILYSESETEIVEFKEAKIGYDFIKIGKYFSALCNEANLMKASCAWLIFGIEDKNHTIVGSKYRINRRDLDNLKNEIADKTTNRITFMEIYEIQVPEGRVIMFQIPAAPKGIPVAFDGHYYGRDNSSLVPLNIEEIERIRKSTVEEDWSAAVIPYATINDLDKKAILFAREKYKNKFPQISKDVDNWDDTTFLNKAKITIKGKITRTAIILLGKEESEHFINPAEAKIRWVLKDNNNMEKDYSIFSCPFLLHVDIVYSKIRILKYRYIKDGSLFPDEIDQYEPFTIREALNNCIAHQDYTKSGRINVVETEDRLVFSNLGSFIPGSVQKVVYEDAPEEHYRNPFLVTAMFNLNMVDTAGGGIKKMFNFQRERFFPLPDYDITGDKVKVSIIGKVLDIQYAKVLARNSDLTLYEIIMLDKVQKRLPLSIYEEKHLKAKKLIEGRKPNYFISLNIAQKTGQKATYTKMKAFDKSYYQDLILKAIKQHGNLTRSEVNDLLWEKLPDRMSENQKKNKITNLLAELRQNCFITNEGSDFKSKWVLVSK